MKLILIGGGDYRKKENKEIDDQILKTINLPSKMLLIPYASPKEKHESWFNTISSNFKDRGINSFDILTEEDDSESVSKKIKSSQILFLIGGDPKMLLDEIRKRNLEKEILSFEGTIVGYSAGAMIFGEKCIIPSEKGIEVVQGLNMISGELIPHYEESQEGIFLPMSKNRLIYCVKNQGAVIIIDGNISTVGKVILLENLKKVQ